MHYFKMVLYGTMFIGAVSQALGYTEVGSAMIALGAALGAKDISISGGE